MANGRRVSIRPSGLGGKGVLLFCALELAFLATNYSNLFFLLLAFSAILGALGCWWAARNVRGVEVRDVELVGAAADAGRDVLVRLRAPGRARFDVGVELRLRRERATLPLCHAPMLHGEQLVAGVMAPRPRGVEPFGELRVRSQFPFGLFVAELRLPLDGELVTWPAPDEHEQSRGRGRSGDADGERARAGRGDTLAGLRPFRAGDGLGDVHWKATARRGVAVVKERERDANALRECVLDRRCGADAFEVALSRATALVLAARHGRPLRLLSQDCDLLVDADRGGADDALRWLAAAQPLPADAPPPPLRRGARVLPDSAGGRGR